MTNPHDALFQFVFQEPTLAAAWVRSVLPASIADAIDWPTFAPASSRIPGLRLRSHHADLVFVAELLGGRGFVIFVVEHKSAPDDGLHAQSVRYVVHVRHVVQRRATATLARVRPLVLPLVLSHGGPPILHEPRTELGEALAAAFAPHQPQLTLLVDDLSARSEAELRATDLPPLLLLTCLCLQHTRDRSPSELLAALVRWADLLRAVEAASGPPSPGDALDAIGWYLVDTSDLTEHDVQMAFEQHLTRPETARMTTGQRIRLEARNQGRTEGRTEGQALTLLRQLHKRFGPVPTAVEQRIRGASPNELERWLDRILDAATVDDLFAAD